jgi:hypothetical protein
LFAAAQQVAGQRRGSRSGPGLNRHPQTRRSYPLRSLVTCGLCGRKMRGKLRRKARRDYLYYACEPPRSVGRQVAADRQPEHPASVLVRGDVLLGGVLEVFALRLFGPERRALLAQDLPKVARGEVTAWEARLQALQRTLADLQGRQARLVRTLEERDDPGGTLFVQIARRLEELDREQQARLAELRAVVAERPDADEQAVELLELLPLLTPERLAAAPEPLLRTLFERFQLQVRYHKPQNQATVRVALSDDSLDGLLTSVQDIEGGAARQHRAVSAAGAVSLAGGWARLAVHQNPAVVVIEELHALAAQLGGEPGAPALLARQLGAGLAGAAVDHVWPLQSPSPPRSWPPRSSIIGGYKPSRVAVGSGASVPAQRRCRLVGRRSAAEAAAGRFARAFEG